MYQMKVTQMTNTAASAPQAPASNDPFAEYGPEIIQNGYDHLPTKSARIRALARDGMKRADIARKLNIRYQHVKNVLDSSK
jgi:DNA-binding NarL/FixJ family response regulator